MEKEKILNIVENLTAEQLAKEIFEGNITLPELMATNGSTVRFSPEKRKQTELCLLKLKESEKINILNAQEEDDRNKKRKEIISNLKQNRNAYKPDEIKEKLDDGVITKDDLINECNIPEDIFKILYKDMPMIPFNLGDAPNAIPNGFTEVYFWGIPGSGKTCALAAILSTAEKKYNLEIPTGPGYDYTHRLKNIFHASIANLPPATQVEKTQYLPFILRKENDKPRSVSLIELSGEIFRCIYKKNAGTHLEPNLEKTLNCLTNYLKDSNRKIHFFFIDYEKTNELDDDQFTQSDYLSAASTYFNNNEVFSKSTDAVYIVLTKSDLMPNGSYEQRIQHGKEYLKNNNFTAFITTLKDKCKKYNINYGELTLELFSLGTVCFCDFCIFDDASAQRIIEILIKRIEPTRKTILNVFNQ
jgi:hypothetical protein